MLKAPEIGGIQWWFRVCVVAGAGFDLRPPGYEVLRPMADHDDRWQGTVGAVVARQLSESMVDEPRLIRIGERA